MSDELKIIIIDNDEASRMKLYNELSKDAFQILLATEGEAAIKLIKRNKVNVALVDISVSDFSGIDFFKEIKQISPQTEIIIISEKITYGFIMGILESNVTFGFIEKPIDFKKLKLAIKEIRRRVKLHIEMQVTLNHLFESYNQLEFLMTVLLNDYENSASLMKNALDILNSTKISAKQKKSILALNEVYNTNNRLITHFYNLRSVLDIDTKEFIKLDLIQIISDNLSELKLSSDCKVQRPDNFEVGNYFTRGTFDGINTLFSEILYSLTIPQTNLCKSLSLAITESDEHVKNSIEVEIKSILHKLEDSYENSINNLSTQQYGFGFFVVRNLIDKFEGKLLLEDSKKENLVETKMVVILPKY